MTNKSCFFSVLGVLRCIFKGLYNHSIFTSKDPYEEVMSKMMGNDEWSIDEQVKVFDKALAKKGQRKIVKRMGIKEEFLIPERLHHCGEVQVFWPIMKISAENGDRYEDRRNLFWCVKQWVPALLESDNITVDATFS